MAIRPQSPSCGVWWPKPPAPLRQPSAHLLISAAFRGKTAVVCLLWPGSTFPRRISRTRRQSMFVGDVDRTGTVLRGATAQGGSAACCVTQPRCHGDDVWQGPFRRGTLRRRGKGNTNEARGSGRACLLALAFVFASLSLSLWLRALLGLGLLLCFRYALCFLLFALPRISSFFFLPLCSSCALIAQGVMRTVGPINALI